MQVQAFGDQAHDPDAKRRRYDLVPALEQYMLQVPTTDRKSSLLGPTMLLNGHEGEVYGCEFSQNGRFIATCSHDKSILLWNTFGECENFGALKAHTNAVLEVHWSSDGMQVYSCSADKSVQCYDVETGKRIKKMGGHQAIVNSCNISREGPNMLVSGGDDGTTKLWDLRTKRCVHTYEHQYQILAVTFDKDASRTFAGSLDNTIICYDNRKQDEEFIMEGHKGSITSVDLSPDGDSLLTNSMDNTIRVWDVRTLATGNRQRQQLTGHHHSFEQLLIRSRWSPDGNWIGSGSSDRYLHIWDAKSGQLTYSLPGHTGSVNDVSFHPLEPIVASASSDRKVYLGELGD